MKPNPLVSILVPIYGVEKHIEKCAHSLFGQTYENIEYIFVNDCTKDKSIQVLADVLGKYPQRKEQVKIINHTVNRGLSSSRNTALDNATGDYVMHVDSDDYLDLNAIDACIDMVNNTGSDCVRLGINRVRLGDIRPEGNIYFTDKDEALKMVLLRQTVMTVWGILYSKKLLDLSKVRSVDGISYAEDYCTLPRILFYAEKVAFAPTACYNYSIDNFNSLTSVYSLKNYIDARNSIIVLDEFFSSVGQQYLKEFQIGAMLFQWEMLRSCVSNKDKECWNILRSFKSYDLSLVPSIKYRLLLYLVRINQFYLLRLLYKLF